MLRLVYLVVSCRNVHGSHSRSQKRRTSVGAWAGAAGAGGAGAGGAGAGGAGAAARELHRDKGLRFVADGYELVPTKQWDDKFRAKDQSLPKGAYLWYKVSDYLWWLGQIHSINVLEADTYIVRFLDDPGPVQLKLRPDSYTTSPSAPRGSWCLQRSKSHGLRRGLQRNVDRTHDVHAPS